MKILTIAVFVFASLLPQKSEPNIHIVGEKNIYQPDDTVHLTIENTLDSTVYYYLGVQKYLHNEWREGIIDITNPASKKAKIIQINRTNKRVFTFQIRTIGEAFSIDSSEYRIILNYGFSANAINKRTYSEPFRIRG